MSKLLTTIVAGLAVIIVGLAALVVSVQKQDASLGAMTNDVSILASSTSAGINFRDYYDNTRTGTTTWNTYGIKSTDLLAIQFILKNATVTPGGSFWVQPLFSYDNLTYFPANLVTLTGSSYAIGINLGNASTTGILMYTPDTLGTTSVAFNFSPPPANYMKLTAWSTATGTLELKVIKLIK